jgi:hypothetical protein
MTVTQQQAEADLAPYIVRLEGSVQGAIAEFLREEAAKLAFWRRTTVSNALRDYIVRNIKAEFPDGEEGIVHKERGGLFLLTIKDRYALRFKKLDRRLRSRNILTQLTLDFLFQKPLTLFPELEEVVHLNVGYQPGPTLAMSTVWITQPAGPDLAWKFRITPDTSEPTYLPMRTPGINPATRGGAQARPRNEPGTGTEAADGTEG